MARVSNKAEKGCHSGKTDKEKTWMEPDKECSFCTGLQAGSYLKQNKTKQFGETVKFLDVFVSHNKFKFCKIKKEAI